MKQSLYVSLMIVLFLIVSRIVYLSLLVVLIRYGIVPLREVLMFTHIAMSQEAYIIVALLGTIGGYFFGQKWWKIIYVDGVYYFNKEKLPSSQPVRGRRTVKKEVV